MRSTFGSFALLILDTRDMYKNDEKVVWPSIMLCIVVFIIVTSSGVAFQYRRGFNYEVNKHSYV